MFGEMSLVMYVAWIKCICSMMMQAMDKLQDPGKMNMLVDPELKNVKAKDLSVICDVVSMCVDPDPSKRPSMQIICAMLEDGIDISVTAVLHQSSVVWAELALAS